MGSFLPPLPPVVRRRPRLSPHPLGDGRRPLPLHRPHPPSKMGSVGLVAGGQATAARHASSPPLPSPLPSWPDGAVNTAPSPMLRLGLAPSTSSGKQKGTLVHHLHRWWPWSLAPEGPEGGVSPSSSDLHLRPFRSGWRAPSSPHLAKGVFAGEALFLALAPSPPHPPPHLSKMGMGGMMGSPALPREV